MAHSFSYPHSSLSPMDALNRPVRRRRFGDDRYVNGYVSINSIRYVHFLIFLESLQISWHLPSWYSIGCVLAGNYLFPSYTSHMPILGLQFSLVANNTACAPFLHGNSTVRLFTQLFEKSLLICHDSCIFRSFPISSKLSESNLLFLHGIFMAGWLHTLRTRATRVIFTLQSPKVP